MVDFEKLGVFYLGREYDAARNAVTSEPLLYDARDLTTHAVCVGMTGSGKTGLCVTLIEEAAIDGIPTLVIDPKGDIANLALNFPALAPGDFLPWVEPAEAARKGLTVEDLAAATAKAWRDGLAEWGQDPARIARLKASAEVAIYTPGSKAGRPLSMLRSFAPPAADAAGDATASRDRIGSVVSGLLGLVGIAADPLRSREHILLSNLMAEAWGRGHVLDLAALIARVQKPPFEKIGVFDVETFYPAKERLELAMALNGLLASPAFGTWLEGEPLDIQRLLFTAEGRPRIAIISIAHLADAERMFVVTLVLNELIAWMRAQSGTASLRALFYMDEIFGYFPPSAMPPSKLPMLTLLKQARAFGLGLVLSTQNPVDLDYKGLGNAGTWFIGRLQTERDKARVIEGLESALTGAGAPDRATLEKLMSSLGSRVFLMRNVHDDAPVLMKTRWALSYLRGPMTLAEIQTLEEAHAAVTAGPVPPAAATSATQGATAVTAGGTASLVPSAPVPAASVAGTSLPAGERPLVPPGVDEIFLQARPGSGAVTYRPAAAANLRLHYVDAKARLDDWRSYALVAPYSDDGREVLWHEATELVDLRPCSGVAPAAGATFAETPPAALRAASYAGYGRALAAHVYQHGEVELLVCDSLQLYSHPGESEGDFRARLALAARERRDAEVQTLRAKHAAKLQTLGDQIRRAQDRVARERSQHTQSRLDAAVSVGASVLGAIFGSRRGALGRISTAARSAGRMQRESGEVARAEDSLEVLQARLEELESTVEQDVAALTQSLAADRLALRRLSVAPRKSDIAVGAVMLAWVPWRTGSDGLPAAAWP